MSNTLDNNRPDHDAAGDHATDEDIPQSPSACDGNPLQVEILIDPTVESTLSSDRIAAAVRAAASYRGFPQGEVGVRVTDDATIRQVNREHLQHDYATDVISFGYSAEHNRLTGELIVSADTAAKMATHAIGRANEVANEIAHQMVTGPDWSAAAELLLYVVHGTLHLTGMQDSQPADRHAMRHAEAAVMTQLGWPGIAHVGADALEESR